jgi:uncharacterized membrane protein
MWMTVLFACVISIASYVVINYLIKNTRSLLAGDPSVAQKSATNLLAIFAALITCVITSFVVNFSRGYDISGSVEQWGQMGDFFGGMLNPILAFASFIALLYTIRIQSAELRLTREEFAKSVKAQERMAGEAERARKQNALLEDYQYICTSMRAKIKILDDIYNEPLTHQIIDKDYGTADKIILRNIINEARLIIGGQQDSLPEHEKFEAFRAWFYESYKAPACHYANAQFDQYCSYAMDLHQLFKTYVDLCTQLELGGGPGGVQGHDCDAVARHLFNAYLACELLQLYYSGQFFIPKVSSEALFKFNDLLSWYKLEEVNA